MRVTIDIPEEQLRELAALCTRERTSRATIIREAIDSYLAARRQKAADGAFGL